MAEDTPGELRPSTEENASRPGDIRITRDPRPVPATPDLTTVREELQGEITQPTVANETPEELPQQTTKPSFIDRAKGGIKRGYETFTDTFGGVRKMPPEDINANTVAYIIQRELQNRVTGTSPGEKPFTVYDVMANAGYVAPWNNTDAMHKFPDVYPRFRQSLASLEAEGVLERSQLDEPDRNNETLIYRIPTDQTAPERLDKLKSLAAAAAEVNPRYK